LNFLSPEGPERWKTELMYVIIEEYNLYVVIKTKVTMRLEMVYRTTDVHTAE